MKYIRNLMLIASLPLCMAACDDSDDIPQNATQAAVSFQESSTTVKEDVTFVTVPITVSGTEKRNRDISVRVALKDSHGKLKMDRDIILTTDTYRIPAGTDQVNLEVGLRVANDEMEMDRFITFEISEVEGASVGANKDFTIHIIENNFIEGTYTIRGINPLEGYMSTGRVMVNALGDDLENVVFDFGLGASIPVKFVTLVPDRLYAIEIEPFQVAGVYNGENVYLSWSLMDEKTGKLNYEKDGVKPSIKGIFEILPDAEGRKIMFTMNDGFGLVSYENGQVAWYPSDLFQAKTTITKED